MLFDHLVAMALADLTGLGVDVLQITVLVEEDDGRLLAVEDRPVAQHDEIVQLTVTTLHVLRLQLQCDLLFLMALGSLELPLTSYMLVCYYVFLFFCLYLG